MFYVVPTTLVQNQSGRQPEFVHVLRALLVEVGDRLVLIDCGIGDKQSEKFSATTTYKAHSLDPSWRKSTSRKTSPTCS